MPAGRRAAGVAQSRPTRSSVNARVKRQPGTTADTPKAKKAPSRSTEPKEIVKTKRRKFLNEPIEFDGFKFDSKAEGARYIGLSYLLKTGEIRDLEVHPRFPLVINEVDCGYYEADFSYIVTATGERVVEDVKSPTTRKLPTYRLKVKQVWALYGLRVREVMA